MVTASNFIGGFGAYQGRLLLQAFKNTAFMILAFYGQIKPSGSRFCLLVRWGEIITRSAFYYAKNRERLRK